MAHVTYRLTAKNRDQLRNPTLGNRVWATFYIYLYVRLSLAYLRNYTRAIFAKILLRPR